MKLQVAFDMPRIEEALELATRIQEYVDIIEVGTVLLYTYGSQAITRFREILPHKTILADMKIVDRGREACTIALRAGADWTTVLAGTSKNVIHATCLAAKESGKSVMLDLIDANSLGQSALEAESLGVNAILFHKPADDRLDPLSLLEQWEMVRGNTKLPIYISAPVTRETITPFIDLKPQGIVLGSNITESENPLEEIAYFRQLIPE